MLIILFLVLHFNFLFVPCGRLSWLHVRFLLHVKHTHYEGAFGVLSALAALQPIRGSASSCDVNPHLTLTLRSFKLPFLYELLFTHL